MTLGVESSELFESYILSGVKKVDGMDAGNEHNFLIYTI